MNPRTLLSLVLGLLTLTSMACGPTSLYYHDVYFPRDPIGEGRREWLVAEIDKALGSKINHLEYETPEGALTVYPRPEGTDESSLPRLPLATLEVLRTAIDRGLRGAESDQLIPTRDGQRTPVTVLWDMEDRVRIQIGAPLPAAQAGRSAAEIVTTYGVGGVDGVDRSWSAEQLRSLELALALLSENERRLLRSVVFRRRERAVCGDADDVAGCYRGYQEDRRQLIDISDGAFSADRDLFVGSFQRPLPASTQLILHEIGHALSDGARAELQRERYRAQATYRAAVTRINALQPLLEQTPPGPALAAVQREIDGLQQEMKRAEQSYETHTARVQEAWVQSQVRGAYARTRGEEPGPTRTGQESMEQSFAESFSLFRADPEALRRIYPAVYDWFARDEHVEAINLQLGALAGLPAAAP